MNSKWMAAVDNFQFKYKLLGFHVHCFYEKLTGLDFTSVTKFEQLGHNSVFFYASAPSGDKWLRRAFNNLPISAEDSIIDIGCGKGSAMKIMLEFPFSAVDGIELSDEIARIARNNFQRLRFSPERYQIITADACEFNQLDSYNYVYLYNPFHGEIMKKFLLQLNASIKRRPRQVSIIYNNPVFHDEVLATETFHKCAEFPDAFGMHIYLYSNK